MGVGFWAMTILTPRTKVGWSFMACRILFWRFAKLTEGELPKDCRFIRLLNPYFFMWWGAKVFQSDFKMAVIPESDRKSVPIIFKREPS